MQVYIKAASKKALNEKLALNVLQLNEVAD